MRTVLPRESGIYQIINKINGHSYIGSSRNIHSRMVEHISRLRHNKGSRILQRAFNKYGEDSFYFMVLEICDISSLRNLEQKYIDKLCPEYNLSPLASGLIITEEIKEKIRIGLRKRFTPNELRARVSYMTSFIDVAVYQSDRFRREQSIRSKGFWKNPEYRNKILSSKTKGNYKLNAKQVVEIKNKHKSGIKIKELSLMFDVSRSTIKAILSGRNWSQVK